MITKIKNQISKIKNRIQSLKLPKLKPRGLVYKILVSLIILAVLIVFLYGLGIYKYGWTRYGVKTVVKIIPYPAAFVGPMVITFGKFEQQKSFILQFYTKTESPLLDEPGVNRQIIDRLIEQKLVEREFKKQGLSLSQKEIDDEYKKIIEENQGEENIQNMLADLYGMSLEDFKNLIREKLVMERFKNEAITSVHLHHILIKDQARAADVLNQLKAGADFAELAKKFSEDEKSRDKGGDLGFVQRGGIIQDKPMPKEFEQGAFSLDVGQLSPEPVLTEFGYHIFKVTEKKGKIDKSYADWLSETKNKTWIKKFVGQ